MTWEDFLKETNSSFSAECVSAPRKDGVYNEVSVGFYKDGNVWVSGSKGSVRLFKNCPYELMFQMFMQRYNEVKNDC